MKLVIYRWDPSRSAMVRMLHLSCMAVGIRRANPLYSVRDSAVEPEALALRMTYSGAHPCLGARERLLCERSKRDSSHQ